MRVNKVITKKACLMDVTIDFEDGRRGKYVGKDAIVMPKSRLPHVYLHCMHHCDPTRIMKLPPGGLDLLIIDTVLDVVDSVPTMTSKYVLDTLFKNAGWIWDSEENGGISHEAITEKWRSTRDDLANPIRSNDDFRRIKKSLLRRAAWELLGRPDDEPPKTPPDELLARVGPNATLLAENAHLLPADMCVDNTLIVSPCKKTAEYAQFFTCLPALDVRRLITDLRFRVSGVFSYVIVERCPVYTEEEVKQIVAHVSTHFSDLVGIVLLHPTPAFTHAMEAMRKPILPLRVDARTCTVTIMKDEKVARETYVNSAAVKNCANSAARAKNGAVLTGGEIVEIVRVGCMDAGIMVAKGEVETADPISRFVSNKAAARLFVHPVRTPRFVDGAVFMSPADKAEDISAWSLSGICYSY